MKFGRRTFILLIAALTAAVAAAVVVQIISRSMANTKLSELKSPSLVIRKSARALEIYDGTWLVRSFGMALGFSPDGDKEIEGDGRTPEGEFYVFTKNPKRDRKSTRLNSSHLVISYAVFCLKKKT